jgi:excisionase family DNA binding protein
VTGRLLTAREVADRFGLTVETILRWTRSGELPAFKLGTAVRYREADLEAWLEQRATGPAPRGVSPTRDGRARRGSDYAPVTVVPSPTPPRDDAA